MSVSLVSGFIQISRCSVPSIRAATVPFASLVSELCVGGFTCAASANPGRSSFVCLSNTRGCLISFLLILLSVALFLILLFWFINKIEKIKQKLFEEMADEVYFFVRKDLSKILNEIEKTSLDKLLWLAETKEVDGIKDYLLIVEKSEMSDSDGKRVKDRIDCINVNYSVASATARRALGFVANTKKKCNIITKKKASG